MSCVFSVSPEFHVTMIGMLAPAASVPEDGMTTSPDTVAGTAMV